MTTAKSWMFHRDIQKAYVNVGVLLISDLAVAHLQVVQVFRMSLSSDVGLVQNKITTSALFRQQHTRLAPSQLRSRYINTLLKLPLQRRKLQYN